MLIKSSRFITLFIVVSMAQSALGSEPAITISDAAKYYDEKVIAPNIRIECTQLGKQFSDSTESSLSKNDWSVTRADELPPEGWSLELLIVNALSSGNAWSGHRKSVSIEANLYKDGELMDTYEGSRNSGGGIAGGFKGSCAVLKRCVDTLGKDVSKWLERKDIE